MQERLRAASLGQSASLGGGQGATLLNGPLTWFDKRGFCDQEAHAAQEVTPVGGWAAVGGVTKVAFGSRNAHGPGGEDVHGALKVHLQFSDLEWASGIVLLHADRGGERAWIVAAVERRGDLRQDFRAAGWKPERHRLGRGDRVVRQRVTEREEIQHVIDVHMGDDHGREPAEVRVLPQFLERAGSQVKHDVRVAALHQEPGAPGAGVRAGGASTENGQAHVTISPPC